MSTREASGTSAESQPRQKTMRCNGIDLCWFEWHEERKGIAPTILLAHATGFHARIWDAVVENLGSEHHIVSVDLRGHGRSGGEPVEHWSVFGSDLVELLEALSLDSVIGVGHSMGGHAMVEAAARKADCFERLVLVDPVIASPESYGDQPSHLPSSELHPTVKRRRHFDSPAAMVARFENRKPYSLFRPRVLRDYCEHGLLPRQDGEGFELACSPEFEASVYMTSRTNPGIHEDVQAVEIPVLILRAPPSADMDIMDFSASPTWPDLVSRFANGSERLLVDLTHFIPMQDPERVAQTVLRGWVD